MSFEPKFNLKNGLKSIFVKKLKNLASGGFAVRPQLPRVKVELFTNAPLGVSAYATEPYLSETIPTCVDYLSISVHTSVIRLNFSFFDPALLYELAGPHSPTLLVWVA